MEIRFTEYRDSRGYGEDKVYTMEQKDEAVADAKAHWERLSEHDRNEYKKGFAWFYVGVFESEASDPTIEVSDPVEIIWSAL